MGKKYKEARKKKTFNFHNLNSFHIELLKPVWIINWIWLFIQAKCLYSNVKFELGVQTKYVFG